VLLLVVRGGRELAAGGDARLSKEQRRFGPNRVPPTTQIRPREQWAAGRAAPPETAGFVEEQRSQPAFPLVVHSGCRALD
jgi:hypothetical protein